MGWWLESVDAGLQGLQRGVHNRTGTSVGSSSRVLGIMRPSPSGFSAFPFLGEFSSSLSVLPPFLCSWLTLQATVASKERVLWI